MTIEIAPSIHIGTDLDARSVQGVWAIIHAAKEPWHRQILGYRGRAPAPDDPERLVARRGRHLYLNLVDVDKPEWIDDSIIDAAVDFGQEFENQKVPVLIHCNQGLSRSPWLGALTARRLGLDPWDTLGYDAATDHMRSIHPLVRTTDSGMWKKIGQVW